MASERAGDPEGRGATVASDFGGYRLDVRKGHTARLIVSIAGIGVAEADRPGRPSMALEWNGTFTRLALDDHIIFLRDLKRSWFNDEEGWAEVIAFIKSYCVEHEIRERVGIGLSMGASGVLILDHHLRFDRSIVMGPQLMLGREACSWDHRFDDLWSKVDRFRHPDLGAITRRDADIHIVCPIDIVEDVLHVRRLMEHGDAVRISFVHGDHNIGAEMGRRSALDRYVDALLNEDETLLHDVGVFAADRRVFDLTAEWMSGGPTSRLRQSLAELYRSSPANIPEYLIGLLFDGSEIEMEDVRDGDGPYAVHAAQTVRPADLPRLATYGWYDLESQEFMWSRGPYHILRLHVIDLVRFPNARAILTITPLVNDIHRTQTILVSVDGEHVLDITLTFEHHGRRPIEISVPIKSGTPEILLVTPLCASPVTMGINEDTRSLALQLSSVRLLPF